MRLLALCLLGLVCPLAQGAIGISAANFPDGLQSPYAGNAASKGEIRFDYNAQLLGNPDSVLAAKTVTRNNGSNLNTCNTANCMASGVPAATQDAGAFPSTAGFTSTLSLPSQGNQTLAGNGSNQYRQISLNSEAQLTINSAGQTFYVDQLDLGYRSILRLSPGDYWVRSLSTNTESQIQVQGTGLVRLFVRDNWSMAASMLINSPAVNAGGTPNRFYIYSYGSLDLNNGATLSGYAYSAFSQGNNDAINLGSASYVYGALSGENIRLGTNSRVYYSSPSPTLTCLSDNFNRSSGLGSDWVVRGSNYTPAIVNDRLRLTSSSTNVSAMANLQRLLPAAGNLIQVQFRHYAYGGNGADGMAVVFSDAQVTPQPGAFGGPLGYGTKPGIAGFAGGWLGIGLDEYGNFSNEGGPGSVGRRQDSVAVRGSAAGAYTYINGTGGLTPGIDISGSTAGPGHLYRITLDGRSNGQVLLTVERDTGSGLQALPNLNGVNVLAATGQTGQPADFFMSLTGSTGSNTNIHELDDLQLCALQINPVGVQIDHYELEHTGNALTCTPLPVQVKACLDSAVPCTTPYTGAITANISPAGWSGLSFSNGVANAQLAIRTASTVRMKVENTGNTPPLKALGKTWCKSGSNAWGTDAACDVTFADSGFNFVFDPSSSTANEPVSMIAAKQVSGTLQAVKKDALSPRCVPAFVGSRNISFAMGYSNPTLGETAGIANQPLLVNDSSVTHTASTSLSLTFDSTGAAPLTLRYDDAGQLSLTASYTGSAANGDAGLSMSSGTTLKSRPYGLCLQTDSTCSLAGVSDDCRPFPGGIRAGDNFPLRIKAVAWQADGEALTAAELCTGNAVTPKFRLGGIGLAQALVEPASGAPGNLTPNSYSHALGNQSTASPAISEVGVFRITATPPAGGYLGSETVAGGTSDLVGRFIPAYLDVSRSASLTPSCVNPDSLKSFSYQGQPMGFAAGQEPSLTVTGMNRGGLPTRNYDRGDFWRLSPAPERTLYTSVTGVVGLDALGGTPPVPLRLQESGSLQSAYLSDTPGDGTRIARWSDQQLWYSPPGVPSSDDLPFSALISLNVAAAELEDLDGACYTNGSRTAGAACQDYFSDADPSAVRGPGFGGSEVRLGRLQVGNAHGPEFQDLTLALSVESWQSQAGGSSFQLEGRDACTTPAALGAAVLSDFTGNLSAATWTPTPMPLMNNGQGGLILPHPDKDGTVKVHFAAPTWLYYPWDGVTRQAARGLATFGIYKGSAPLIYRREIYRQQ